MIYKISFDCDELIMYSVISFEIILLLESSFESQATTNRSGLVDSIKDAQSPSKKYEPSFIFLNLV